MITMFIFLNEMGFVSFMKILKNIFLLLMLFLFIVTGVMLQSSIVLKNTLFSEDYFQRKLDEKYIDDNIAKFAEKVIDNSEKFVTIDKIENDKPTKVTPEAQKLMDSYKTTMKEDIDIDLIKVETSKTINQLYGYFLLGNEKLPIINIKPIKEIYINLLAQQIIKSSDSDVFKQIDEMQTYIDFISTIYPRDIVIDEIMKLEQVKTINLSREEVIKIVDEIGTSDNTNPEKLFNAIVTKVIKDKIEFYKINEIKDELDLNLLINVKYGEKYNPITGAAIMINTIKNSLFSTVITLYISLFLIIIITAYRSKSILRWIGIGMVISSIIVIMSYIFSGLINANIIPHLQVFNIGAEGLDMTFIQTWILSYINGIWKSMFMCALIFAIVGAIFIIVSFFTHNLFRRKYDYIGINKKTLIMVLRIVTVLMLLTAISVNIVFNIKTIRISVEEYNEIKEKAEVNAMDTKEALGKVLNAEKLIN